MWEQAWRFATPALVFALLAILLPRHQRTQNPVPPKERLVRRYWAGQFVGYAAGVAATAVLALIPPAELPPAYFTIYDYQTTPWIRWFVAAAAGAGVLCIASTELSLRWSDENTCFYVADQWSRGLPNLNWISLARWMGNILIPVGLLLVLLVRDDYVYADDEGMHVNPFWGGPETHAWDTLEDFQQVLQVKRERGWVEQPNLVWVFPGDERVRTAKRTEPLSPQELQRMRQITERLSGREARVVMREER